MAFKEYIEFDGMGLAQLIKKGEVEIKEVVETAIERIEKLNPKLNAVITKIYDEALDSIENLPEGPFKGVPLLLKDVLQMCKNVRYTMGSKLMKDYISPIDSEFVKRLKKAGFVVIGKTNVPEFGLMGTTEPSYFKATHNPWDLKRTPGGSSGGSAAAVASRMVPIAGGNDGGGSIRIPASCCGLFGLKPSRGRTPNGPLNGDVWLGLVVEHVLTRSVRDSAAVLDVVSGSDLGAPFEIKPYDGSYLDSLRQRPKNLKIAFSVESPLGGKVHSTCKEAVYKTVNILESAGFEVDERTPEIDFRELAESYVVLMFGEVKSMFIELENLLGRKITKSDVEISSWILAKIGEFAPMWKINWAKKVWDKAARAMGEFHKKYDLYMTPTMAYPPAKLGELLPSSLEKIALNMIDNLKMSKVFSLDKILEKVAYKQLERLPFTQIANQTGQPAMSVPLYWTKNDLPIGVHFIASFGREDLLLRVAYLLEEAKPWIIKRPKVI